LASEVATIFEVAIERNMNKRFILSQKTVPGPAHSKPPSKLIYFPHSKSNK